MSELIRIVKYFITRDIVYLIGGSILMTSMFYAAGQVSKICNIGNAMLFVLAGLSYIIAVVLTDQAGALGIVSVSIECTPKKKMIDRFEKFTNRPWKEITKDQKEEFEKRKDNLKDDEFRWQLERTVTLQMIGATCSPCVFLAAIGVGVHYVAALTSVSGLDRIVFIDISRVDVPILILLVWLSIGLRKMSWTKGLQQARQFLDQ